MEISGKPAVTGSAGGLWLGTSGNGGWARSCAPKRGSTADAAAANSASIPKGVANGADGTGVADATNAVGADAMGADAVGADPTGAIDGIRAAGAALKNSFDQRVSVAISGSPEAGSDSDVKSARFSPVGVGVVMVLTDLDIVE